MAKWWEQDQLDTPNQATAPQQNWWEEDIALIEDTGQSPISSAAGAAGQGLLSVASGTLGGVDALGSIVGMGSETLRDASQSITEFGEQYSPVNPLYAQSFPVQAAGAVGQAAGQLATIPVGGVAGKLIGGAAGAVRGAQVAGLGSGALMGADAGQDTADRLGIENRAQRAALILGQAGIELGTEMLGGFGSKQFTEGILGRVADMPWRNPSFLSTALAEGGEEVIAGTAQPLLERGVLLGQAAPSGVELTGIPLTSVDATLDVLKQGALGAVAGGFMGGVNSFLNRPEPKAVLDWRLRAKARINELSSAPQLTEEEQSELNQLQTEDQNATEWLQNYGESNIYEPLRQVVDPVSDWRNQRESLIADTEDEAGKKELRRQTNEEIEAATEILERGGNPFSPEASTAALDEALSPPDPVTETAIRAASNDPVVVETKAVADEVDAAGAPATATVLKEQADLKAAENVVAIEQEQLNVLQQDEEQTTPITERAGSTAEAQQATPQVEEGRSISNQELGMVDAQSQLDARTGGILDAERPAIQVPGEGDATGLSEVAGGSPPTAQQVGASSIRNERQIPTAIQTGDNTLYRESSAKNALDFLDADSSFDAMQDSPIFFATGKDLAIGQGDNSGIILEVDGSKLYTRPNLNKPGTQLALQTGQPIERIGNNTQQQYRDAVKAFTLNPNNLTDASGRRLKMKLKSFEKEGWKILRNQDGTVTYRSPNYPIQIDETQTTLTEDDGQSIPSGTSGQDQPIQGGEQFANQRSDYLDDEEGLRASRENEERGFTSGNDAGETASAIPPVDANRPLNAEESYEKQRQRSASSGQPQRAGDQSARGYRLLPRAELARQLNETWGALNAADRANLVDDYSRAYYQELFPNAEITYHTKKLANRTVGVRDAAASASAKANVSVEINPMGIAQRFKSALDSSTLDLILEEEVIHLADFLVQKEKWQQAGSNGSFLDFFDNTTAVDAVSLVESTNPSIRNAAIASWNIYNPSNQKNNIDELRDSLSNASLEAQASFAAEFVRQIIQLRRSGEVSEGRVNPILAKARDFFNQVLDRLKELISWNPMLLTPSVSQRVSEVEQMLVQLSKPISEINVNQLTLETFSQSESPLTEGGIDLSAAFESALRKEAKDLPKWTDERVAEAVEWFRSGKQGDPPWGKPVVSRAVLAVDSQARSEWNKKEQELLRRFKRADVQDQADVDDVQAKQAIERERQSYFEIPSEELSLSVPFQAADGMSNGELAREIRNVKADFESFKQAFREDLSAFQNSYRELSSTVGAQAAWRELEQSNPAGAELYDRYLNRAVNLSRLEAQLEQRGLNPDEPIPEGLEDFVPKVQKERNKPLKKGAASSIQDAWAEISKSEDSFRGKKSTAKDPNTLAQEMSGGKVRGYVDADGDVVFRYPNGGQLSIVDPDSSRPTIWALSADSEGKAQGGGSQLYQIAFAWAHNNGKKIFPSNNLTSINAYVRRTSNMLSSALRYGSTKHLLPDADQRISGWKNGDDKGNIARLAWRESQQVLKAIPQAANIRYDFQTGDFYTQTPQEGAVTQGQAEDAARPSETPNASTGRVNLSPQDLEAIVTESLDGGYANELGIGETTLKRAIITNTATQEQASGSVAAPQGILYSQQEGEDTGATLEDAQKGLQELRSTELGSLMANDVVIVQSLPELREVTANRPFSEEVYGLLNRAEGFFRPSTGESYVILDRVKRLNGESYSAAVKRIIFHERAFHGGFKWMYQNDPSFARQAMDVARMIPKAERDALRDYPGIGDSDIAMLEEWLARKLQQEDPNELAQRDPLFKRIWQAIKDLVARVLGKPVTSEYVDREARRLVGEILRNREAFGNQAMSADEDIVAQRDVDTSTRFSIPFSQREADLNIEQLKQEAGFHADAPNDMVALHQVLGQATDQPYIVQRIRPQADFVRQRIWTGGRDENGNPVVNEENTRNFWRQNDLQTSDPNWAVNLQDDFREMASQSTESELRNNRAEAIGSIAQLELMNYAQLMAANDTTDAQEAVDAIRRGRYANDITLLRYASISGSARALNARAQAARNGMMGFWNGLNMLEDKNEKEVSTTVGKGNVKKIQEAVNNPQDQDIDTTGVEDPTEGLTEDERLGNARDNEAQKIIDKIDESRTEWLGPPKNRSKIQALKREALASELTDTSRPGHLTRDGFVRRYTQAFEALGVSRPVAINLSSRLYDENMRMRTDAFMRQIDSRVRNAGVNQLAKDLLADPLNVLGDPALMKERMIEWLKGAGLTEEQASRWAKRHEKTFREKLIKAKEKALDRAIKGVKTITTPSVERIRQAIRAGALDPVDGVRNAIAEALGAKGLTKEDLQKMAAADLIMRDAQGARYMAELAKIRDILASKSPELTWLNRTTQAWILSALGGVNTISLGATVPAFAGITRLGLNLGDTMLNGVRGRIPKGDIPSALAADLGDYVDSYRGYIDTFRSVWKNDETMQYHAANLNAVDSLRADFNKQMEKIKTGTPIERAKAALKAAQSSTDLVRRVMNALDGASISVFQNLFFRQESRKALQKVGMSPQEISNVFTQAWSHGKEVAEGFFSRGQYDEQTSARIGIDASMDYLQEYMKGRLGSETAASQVRDFSVKEAAYELGVLDPEKIATWDVFYQVTAAVQALTRDMARRNPLLGRLLFGFTSLPLALSNRSLSFTPYGLLRVYWKNRELNKGDNEQYMSTMGSELQRRQRKIEGIAGSMALLILGALAYAGSDDDDENYTGIKFTLNGPKDPSDRDSWIKKGFKPNSIMWVQNGKPLASVNYARGTFESLKLPLIAIGAIEDMKLNGELQNGNIAEHSISWLKSSAAGGLEALAYFGLKNVSSALQLADARASDASIASQLGWTTAGFIPWSGFAKSLQRPFVGQLDQSSAQAAILAQFPLTMGLYGQPSLNSLGDQRGAQPVDLFTKLTDRAYLLGLPLQISMYPDSANARAYELFVKKGASPTIPSRSRLAQSNGHITDFRWQQYVKLRGSLIKEAVYKRYNELSGMARADFEDAISTISSAATKNAKKRLSLN